MRGEELRDQRTAEAADLEDESEGSPVEWSDAEENFNIGDDIPLEADNKIYQLSRKWVEKHATMETPSSRRNMEKELSDRNRIKAEEQGSFNEMDGRYHQEATREALLMKDHLRSTYDRGTCYYHKRGWCKNGFGCTLRHYGPGQRSRYFDEDIEDVEDTQPVQYVSETLKRHRAKQVNEVILQHSESRWTKKQKPLEVLHTQDEDFVYRHFSTAGSSRVDRRINAYNPDPHSSAGRSSNSRDG